MPSLLVVDDFADMRRLLCSMVGDLVDSLFECEDGAEVLAAYTLHRPDWVFMDVEMKITDGLTATRQLLAAFPQAKVVIVTKYKDEHIQQAARQAGAYSLVFKENLLPLREILGAKA